MPVLLRQPRRMTITISDHVYQKLVLISDEQGRSLSNLAAFLLERSLEDGPTVAGDTMGSVGHSAVDRERTLQPLPVFGRQLSGRFDANASTKAKQPVA